MLWLITIVSGVEPCCSSSGGNWGYIVLSVKNTRLLSSRVLRPCSLPSLDFYLYDLSLLSIFFCCFYFASQGHDDAVPCAVLKSVDSFSFLHHPVHQRSLEILQRCKEEKYSKAPPPPLPSDTTLICQEMETRCIQRRKGKKTTRGTF